jgi:hypothetical protein
MIEVRISAKAATKALLGLTRRLRLSGQDAHMASDHVIGRRHLDRRTRAEPT